MKKYIFLFRRSAQILGLGAILVHGTGAVASEFEPEYANGNGRGSVRGAIRVNSTADSIDPDDGVTTLREALDTANATSDRDRIVFHLESGVRTIELDPSLGTLIVTEDLDLIGPHGDTTLVVQGSVTAPFDVFAVDNGARVRFRRITVADGDDGIEVMNGNVVVVRCMVTGAATDGIKVSGNGSSLTVVHSIFDGNGDGIDVRDADDVKVLALQSMFTNNGDGIETRGARSTVLGFKIQVIGNRDEGLDIGTDGQYWAIFASAIEDNGDGGVKIGLDDTANENRITFIRTRIRDHAITGLNQRNGGGILLRGTGNAVTLLGSSVTGNSALDNGGGLFIPANNIVSLLRTEIVDNAADTDGDSTGNGGGLYIEEGANVRLWRTTVDRNQDLGGEFPNVFGNFVDFGRNIIGP